MADLVGPFAPVPWGETEWYTVAGTWAPSGIVGSPAGSVGVGDFAVTASGLTLAIACAGDTAWIDGSFYKPETDKSATAGANAHASWSRRDRLVIRRDRAAKTIVPAIVQGTPAASPVAPTLTQALGGVWELPVCSFLVPANSGTSLSGFVDERRWVDPAGTGLISAGYLGSALGGEGSVGSTATTVASVTVTVPPGLPSWKRLKVTGTCFVAAGPGVGAVLSVGRSGGPSTDRPINQGDIRTDLGVVHWEPDLTPGSRTFVVQTRTTVSSSSLTYRYPQISVEVV